MLFLMIGEGPESRSPQYYTLILIMKWTNRQQVLGLDLGQILVKIVGTEGSLLESRVK